MAYTVLITGIAGYIGSTTAWLLTTQKIRVIGIDSCPTAALPPFFRKQNALTVVYGDCTDQALLEQLLREYQVDAVIHCAARIVVSQSVHSPHDFYYDNVRATGALLDAMRLTGVRTLIFSSSAAVYGRHSEAVLAEDNICIPINPYGNTKYINELMIKDYAAAYGIRFVILRYFNVAGAVPEYDLGERHEPETHLLPLLLRSVYEQKPFMLFGTDYQTPDGSCVRDYVHVRDVAAAQLAALVHLQHHLPSDIFNIGSGVGTSVKELITTVEQVCQQHVITHHAAQRPGDPASLVADISKAINILRWRPLFSDVLMLVRSAHVFESRHFFKRQQDMLPETTSR